MVSDQVLLASRVIPSADRANAVSTAILFGCEGMTQVALGFLADYSAAVASIKTITIKTGTSTAKTGPVDAVTLAIGSTDTAVSTTAFQFAIAEVLYAKAAVAAGTALAAGTIPADTWGIYLLSINAAGTIAVTAGADNFTTGYASEAAAIAALPDTPAASASLGYLTVLTANGQDFIGGTDGLEGGASGNVATTTHYTSTTAIAPTTTVATLRWDFTNGPLYLGLPGVIPSPHGGSISAELAASGAGGTTGRITLMGFAK